jgi:hypothetical protein
VAGATQTLALLDQGVSHIWPNGRVVRDQARARHRCNVLLFTRVAFLRGGVDPGSDLRLYVDELEANVLEGDFRPRTTAV